MAEDVEGEALDGSIAKGLTVPRNRLTDALAVRFFGVTLLQTYQYYDRYWGDSLWLKLFVRPSFTILPCALTNAHLKVALILWVPSRRSAPEPPSLTIIKVCWT